MSEKVGTVMVVGGGIAGMQASLDLADSGYYVYLVEESSSIGGHMAQLDKTFPTNDCSMCIISPKLVEVSKHLNIEIIPNSKIKKIDGEAGNFKVTLNKSPRFVDMEKCNACGDCIEKCPVHLLNEFDEGLGPRTAIHKRYPQAIPDGMLITKTNRPPCVITCPASVNAQGYTALAAEGKFEEAYKVIKRQNPFPSVCGRVCHHPCESECNRKELDEAVAINPLKRFISDYAREKKKAGTAEEKAALLGEKPAIDHQKPKVAIVGSGPSGLTAAQDLVFLGYPVTVFEALFSPGGMMLTGIPSYRLSKEILKEEIQEILDLGVELKTNTTIGKDLSLDDLKGQGYKALYLAIGAQASRRLPIEGDNLGGILGGVEFLKDVNLSTPPSIGKKVVVIGGGNVAVDVALSALRIGAKEVEMFCLEKREEMPAYEWEIEDALEEGVKIHCSWGPERFEGKEGKVNGVCFKRCTSVFDADGRFSPSYDEKETTSSSADTVIVAIGQAADLSFLGKEYSLETVRDIALKSDEVTLETNLPGVFAGGDGVTGPKSVVEAIFHGHEAALSIDRYLKGEDLRKDRVRGKEEPAPRPEERIFELKPRQKEEKLPVIERRENWKEITRSLTEEQAIEEAKRCMNCGYCCECLQCVEACKAEAIDHEMTEKEVELTVGSLILTPGFDKFDPELRGEYGYGRLKNVVTSLEFERLLSASGPFQGHVIRLSDQKEPKKIAWIQCVGSRDITCGRDYCSSVCCTYATKQAIITRDHYPQMETTIFYNDLRTFGKGFDRYHESAVEKYGVRYIKSMISTIKELQQSNNLLISYISDEGEVKEEVFDLVVLSLGLVPSSASRELMEVTSVESNPFGFCDTHPFTPSQTSRPGIYVAGAIEEPRDIPETVMSASSAAALSAELLASERGKMIKEKEYPPEKDISGEPPRVGVFVCRCGTNIARVVEVSSVAEYAKTLPSVVHAEENLYTCSTDTQRKIISAIEEHGINRVVVASCSPRTHEPLFQDTLREAGLNKFLFEMANIRDQCSWVHATHPQKATEKAKDLVKMAVARAVTLEPLKELSFEVKQQALVMGGGVSGMVAALSLAQQGFSVYLIEKTDQLGGNLKDIHYTLEGVNPGEYLNSLIKELETNDKITVYKNAEVIDYSGHVGNFKSTVRSEGKECELEHGVVIVATGGMEYSPEEYHYGESEKVITQRELEEKIVSGNNGFKELKEVVMIQCVGSREQPNQYCSRVCCSQAIKNALKLKEINPEIKVSVLYRDIRSYGFKEIHYRKAREAGVNFLRYDMEAKPEVKADNGKVKVVVKDDILDSSIQLAPDYLVLSAAIRPHPENERLATTFKLPLTPDGFFLEAHMKLRPLDFASSGMFLCGLAHSPKFIDESIAQAKGSASRAATILSQKQMLVGGVVSVIDRERCAACLTCVRICPYNVPVITTEGVAEIEAVSCRGCGICASACPRSAIQVQHYRDEQIIKKCAALF
jgi:heterodisulfide reductase subunit A-like polyferredoxin